MTLQRAACALACLALLAGPAAGQSTSQGTGAGERKDTVTMTGKPKTGPGAWDRVAGNWKLFRGKIKKQWAKLTKDDIAAANGRREELAGRIQARYGIDKTQADAQIDAWIKAQK
jgi:uncharacterized protein YjbJ (UPF0337 family)